MPKKMPEKTAKEKHEEKALRIAQIAATILAPHFTETAYGFSVVNQSCKVDSAINEAMIIYRKSLERNYEKT